MKERYYGTRRLLGVSVIAATLALRTITATAGESGAIQNLKAKAAAGDVNAQLSLARAYDFGNGVRANSSEAAKWYEAAAELGNADAQNSIGSLYLWGEGVSKNPIKACDWFAKSAAQEYIPGIGNLGYCYDFGIGVEQDRTKGAVLYEQAASGGDLQSMLNIGICYWKGVGVDKDLAKGYMWLDLARFYTQTGHANRMLKWRARGALDALTKQITPAIQAQGEALSHEWEKANRAIVRPSPAY